MADEALEARLRALRPAPLPEACKREVRAGLRRRRWRRIGALLALAAALLGAWNLWPRPAPPTPLPGPAPVPAPVTLATASLHGYTRAWMRSDEALFRLLDADGPRLRPVSEPVSVRPRSQPRQEED